MSGDIAPIPEYIDVLQGFGDYSICVDDAHAAGVIGEMGRGCFEYLDAAGSRLFSSGTLSKAFGGHGGIIAGDADLIERLKRSTPIAAGSSSPATPAAAAAAKGLELLQKNPQFRKQLWENALYAKQRLRSIGFDINDTPVPIICLAAQDLNLESLPDRLLERGTAVSRYYSGSGDYSSVPAGGAVRTAVFSTHSRDQIDRLADQIRALV